MNISISAHKSDNISRLRRLAIMKVVHPDAAPVTTEASTSQGLIHKTSGQKNIVWGYFNVKLYWHSGFYPED